MNKIQTKLKLYPLGSVEVTDDYCVNALQKEIAYLLSLDENRLLAGFYENAGLKTPFVRYGGWESGLIGGHTLGHYLTAVSQGYANSGVSASDREQLWNKLKKIIDGLAECQAHSLGKEGFLWGAPKTKYNGVEAQFDNVEKGKLNIKREAWVPWYTMHKLIAGLLDAYLLTGYATSLAVATKLGDWVYRRVVGWDTRLRKKVLSVEYGGMNDCLYELYSITQQEKYAIAAHVFDEEKLFDSILTEGEHVLKDKHANTMIPKIIGALNRYLTLHGKMLDGKKINADRYLRVAQSFWKIVVERHTYVTGGYSEWEHFGKDYILDSKRTNCNCETCNVYNMLKLSRLLFCVTGDKKYTDYYDNAFVNSILSSQNPKTGMTTYFQPMAGGFFKVYSRPYDNFWCCTGTGMENFTKLGDSAYYTNGSSVFIEQYLSSLLRTERYEILLRCNFPLSDEASIKILHAQEPFELCMRIPDWAAERITILCNGLNIVAEEKDGHVCIRVTEGDCLIVKIPVAVTLKGLPDGDSLAFQYGGAVLSANLGRENMLETQTGVDVTIPQQSLLKSERVYFSDLAEVLEHPENYLIRNGESFCLNGGDIPLEFGLHYKKYDERYAIYWRLREGKRENDIPEGKETRELYDSVQPGYGQYETDELHEMHDKNSVSLTLNGTARYSKAGGFFSYDFAVDPSRKNTLRICLLHKDNGKTLKITAGGEKLYSGWINYTYNDDSYFKEFEIPAELIARFAQKKTITGKQVTVLNIRFEGLPKKVSAKLYDKISIYCE